MNHDLHPRYRHLVTMVLLLLALSTTGFAATLEISGPAGASVVVNGVGMGFLPLNQPLTLPPGLYEIKSDLPGYLPYATTVQLVEVTDWQRLQIRPIPMSKKTAWSSNILFAGLGQHYIGKSAKGYFFNVVEAGGLLTALAGEVKRSSYRKDYLLHQSKYESAINPEDILFYKDLTNQAYSDMEDSEKLRNTGLMVAGGAIVLSIVDILIFFPSIEGGMGETPLQTGFLDSNSERPDFFQENNPLKSVHAGLKLSF